MIKRLRMRLTYANVVSTICLLVLLSGTAVAATVISGASIVDEPFFFMFLCDMPEDFDCPIVLPPVAV